MISEEAWRLIYYTHSMRMTLGMLLLCQSKNDYFPMYDCSAPTACQVHLSSYYMAVTRLSDSYSSLKMLSSLGAIIGEQFKLVQQLIAQFLLLLLLLLWLQLSAQTWWWMITVTLTCWWMNVIVGDISSCSYTIIAVALLEFGWLKYCAGGSDVDEM